MSWRLICSACRLLLHQEIKSVGILEHPDTSCASCGNLIRTSTTDRNSLSFPITEEDLLRLDTLRENAALRNRLDEFHGRFIAVFGELDLTDPRCAEDAIARALALKARLEEANKILERAHEALEKIEQRSIRQDNVMFEIEEFQKGQIGHP